MVDREPLLGFFPHVVQQRRLGPVRIRSTPVILADLAVNLQFFHDNHRPVIDILRIDPLLRQEQVAAIRSLCNRHDPVDQAVTLPLPGYAPQVHTVCQPDTAVDQIVLHQKQVPIVPDQLGPEVWNDTFVRIQEAIDPVFVADIAGIRSVIFAGQIGGDLALVIDQHRVPDPGNEQSRIGQRNLALTDQHTGQVIAHMASVYRHVVVLGVEVDTVDPEQLILHRPRWNRLNRFMPNERDLAILYISRDPILRADFRPIGSAGFHIVNLCVGLQRDQHRIPICVIRNRLPVIRILRSMDVPRIRPAGIQCNTLIILTVPGHLCPDSIRRC